MLVDIDAAGAGAADVSWALETSRRRLWIVL